MEGAAKRLRPKVMTVATMFLGLIPIMWATGTGSDVWKRIAAPMAGGIFTSFVLELVVYPAIYEIWKWRFELKRAGAEAQPAALAALPSPEFRLRVRDDGKGIDREVLAALGIEGHYGLRGMPEWAAVIGGNLTVWSEVGAGTEVELCLPAGTVYATSARRSWWSRRFAAKAPADVEGDAS